MKYLLLALGFVASLNTYATPFSLEDNKVDAYMAWTVDTGFGVGRINGFGLDSPFTVHTGTDDAKQYSNVFNLNVDKNKFTIDFLSKSGWQDGITFRLEQPDYATTTTEAFWYSLGEDTNIDGLDVSIGLGWVELKFGNIHFTEDSYFTGYFNYREVSEASVPEPASYILLLLGLVGIFFKARYSASTRKP